MVPVSESNRGSKLIGHLASLACLEECSAPKPGNVHRGADFEDVTFYDFQVSAVCLGMAIDAGIERSIGATVLDAVKRTQLAVGTNTNLGLVLLLVPLAKAAQTNVDKPLTIPSIQRILSYLTAEDSSLIYAAIRLASPGGLGDSEEHDLNAPKAPSNLLDAMRHAASWDSIAKQYTNNFSDVIHIGPKLLSLGQDWFSTRPEAIVFAHVAWLAMQGDTLIARKCGQAVSDEARDRAAHCLQVLSKGDAIKLEAWMQLQRPSLESIQEFQKRISDLDFWMRSDGHRRNPGTTADLVGASLFVQHLHAYIRTPS